MQLRRGALPADISHIGRARAKGFPGEKRKQHIIHCGTGQERFYPGGIIGIFAAAARDMAASIIGCGKLSGKSHFLRGMLGHTHFGKVLVQQSFQHMVGDGLRHAINELPFTGGAGHQGSSGSDIIHPFLQLHRLFYLRGAHHIQYRCFGLHHIGAAAAAIGHGIVDAGLRFHVLPQELHPHIHQCYRIQGTAAPLRVPGRMGGHPVENILHLNAGIAGAGRGLVAVIGVPGQSSI